MNGVQGIKEYFANSDEIRDKEINDTSSSNPTPDADQPPPMMVADVLAQTSRQVISNHGCPIFKWVGVTWL